MGSRSAYGRVCSHASKRHVLLSSCLSVESPRIVALPCYCRQALDISCRWVGNFLALWMQILCQRASPGDPSYEECMYDLFSRPATKTISPCHLSRSSLTREVTLVLRNVKRAAGEPCGQPNPQQIDPRPPKSSETCWCFSIWIGFRLSLKEIHDFGWDTATERYQFHSGSSWPPKPWRRSVASSLSALPRRWRRRRRSPRPTKASPEGNPGIWVQMYPYSGRFILWERT